MSKGKRGRKAQLRQPVKGDVQGGKMWVNQLRAYEWTAPCKLCKRFGRHDPDCSAYVHKA
jgi:hypothetical protein